VDCFVASAGRSEEPGREETQQREQQMSDASSHAAGWRQASHYPDPAIHALDPRFEKYWLKLSAIERLTTGLRWAEGPVWFGDGRYLLCSDIPNQRIIKWVGSLAAKDFSGRFTYTTVSDMRTISQRLAPALDHFFNHQTHHRGQARMILTALGQPSVPLDLVMFQRTEEGRAFA
jgi:hypothetical protein